MGIISIINALSAGTAEIPPKGDTKLKLPEFIDAPQWNKASNFIIFTGGDAETGKRNIWGISLALSRMQQYLKNKEKNNILLVSDIKKIIDQECMPITHKTAWSSDSKNFVFAAKTKKDGVFNLWTSDINRQSITPITKGFNKILPLWSPAEDKILYVSKTDSYSYLRISNYNGSNAHEFNPGRKSDRELLPCWDPNEAKVIFAKGHELMIMNANATKKVKLTKETFTPRDYWLSPERKKLKINFTETGDIWRVWTIEKNGKHNKEIFEQVCSGFSQPKWSYDGNTVALNADYGKTNSIWIFGKNGEIPLKIYTSQDKISFLEWSPSSKKLAFLVKKFLKQELWVINSDGTKPKKLYSTFGDIGNIAWDNDDKRLVFDETFSHILFVPEITTAKIVHSRTGEMWRLLPYNFYSKYPAWSEKGDMIAYIGWKEIWLPSTGYKIWIARLQ
jgi:Tol biopolymer transport system component